MLDAGSGGGSFLPLLAELVGPAGYVTALDLDPGNVAASRRRLAVAPLACPVVATAGSVLALPFPDAHFDAAWCANVAQYWDDAELAVAL